MIVETVVEEIAQRLQQARGSLPSSVTGNRWLQNRWLQLGVAVAVGYAIGRTRNRVQLGPFGRTLASAALTTLLRTALQSNDRTPHGNN